MKKRTFYFPCQKDFWQGLKTFVLALLVVSGCIDQSKAQTVSIDPTFNVFSTSSGGNVGLERAVTKVIIQPDGKIIAGGIFRNFVGAPNTSLEARRIVRLNANGSRDATFSAGQGFGNTGNNVVNAMVIQPDGKIIIGGNLDSYDNLTGLGHIARANSDGSRDINFNNRPAGSAFRSFNNPVYAILLQPDGKVVVGGGFDTYNQSNVNPNARRIARLNPDGTQDLTFNNGGSGFNVGVLSGAGERFAVFALALQSDGKIIAGGDFTTYNGVAARKIIRLNSNGSVDASFNVGMGFSDTNQLYTIALQSDGKILVGGSFTSFSGATSNYILRLNIDGSRDASFNIGTGFNSYVNDIFIQPDGKIIVAGNFTSFNNATANYLIRLNNDGTRDNTFTTGNSFDGEVYSIALQPDNKIVAGGAFVRYNGTVVNHLTRLNIASTPTITTTGTLTAFSTCAGTPSATQTYTVSGSNLTGNISIAAPSGFEISSNGTSFSNTLTLNATNGAVANATITVRLAANASGSPSGNITHTSGTATPRNVAVTGTVNALPTITLGAISNVTTTALAVAIPYTATSGSPNQYSITTGTNALAGFVAVSNQPLPASPIALTLPATKTAGTYNFNLTVRNSVTGCVSAVVPFSIVVGTAISTPTITLTGTLNPFNSCAGTASTVQTYTLSVTNATEDLVVTPPAGFQVSNNGTDYFAVGVFPPPASGTGSATISVRLAANASGSPSGNITHTSGTVTQNLAVSGTVNPAPTITLGTIPSVTTTATSVGIPYTATSGSPNQYSITTGTNALAGFVAVSNQALPASPIALTLPATKTAGTYNFNLTVRNSTTGCVSAVVPFSIVVGTATANFTITFSGTLNPFNSCVGTASNVQTYTFSVTNMTEDLVVTPPAGFQISANATDYFASIRYSPPTSGSGSGSATVSVRLAANASGSPSGNITHTSGTVTQNLAVSGTVNPIPTITLGTIPSINTRSTSFTIPYTATTGSPNQFSLTAGTNALPGFVPINKQTLPASPITIPVPQNTVAGNYNFNLIVHNSATGCESMVIPFTLNNVMSAVDEEFSNSILAYPNPTSNKITVQLPRNAKIEAIKLLNPLGQEVASLSKQEIQEQLQFDLSSYASGVYYLHVIEQKRVAVKRINLTK